MLEPENESHGACILISSICRQLAAPTAVLRDNNGAGFPKCRDLQPDGFSLPLQVLSWPAMAERCHGNGLVADEAGSLQCLLVNQELAD